MKLEYKYFYLLSVQENSPIEDDELGFEMEVVDEEEDELNNVYIREETKDMTEEIEEIEMTEEMQMLLETFESEETEAAEKTKTMEDDCSLLNTDADCRSLSTDTQGGKLKSGRGK